MYCMLLSLRRVLVFTVHFCHDLQDLYALYIVLIVYSICTYGIIVLASLCTCAQACGFLRVFSEGMESQGTHKFLTPVVVLKNL